MPIYIGTLVYVGSYAARSLLYRSAVASTLWTAEGYQRTPRFGETCARFSRSAMIA